MKLSIIVAAVCMGCGVAEGPFQPPTTDDAGSDDTFMEIVPACVATNCCPQNPTVCNDWRFKQGPNDPGPLLQYSINCRSAPGEDAGNCFPWSYDPAKYSPQSWALCCYP